MTSPVRAPRPTPRRTERAAPTRARGAHLRVVPPAERTRRPRTGAFLTLATGLVFGSLLVAAVFHGLLASGQANLDRLDRDLQQERSALANEKLELAHLQSPQRIATEAEAMGMQPADRQHWVSAADGEQTVIDRVAPETTDPTDPTAGADAATDPATDPEVPAADDSTNELATATTDGTPE